MSERKRRLKRVEGRLTPAQAAVLWMEEAHRFPSMAGYVRSLADGPIAAHPLTRLAGQVEAATREAMKGRDRDDIDAAVRKAERDVAFLYHLHQQSNLHVMDALEPWRYRLLWLGERLRGLLARLGVSDAVTQACARFDLELPAPLDPETAAAVDAARRHAVVTWESLVEMETVAEWVTAQYVEEGRTELPVWASLVRSPEPRLRVIRPPSENEVRAAFGSDEAAFAAFMAGEDFSCGLADVSDADYERRCRDVEAGLRGLVEGGVVEAGALLRLDTAPMLFLREAPLVDGVWLDRGVAGLAEWGALLERSGFTPREDGDHPLALPRFRKGTDEAGVEELHALRQRARSRLERCPGRVREIDGRAYLHVEDYIRWRGRAVKGDLTKRIERGFTTDSWNGWVGDQGDAKVAGVRVEEIPCWAEGFRYEVREDAAAVREARSGMLGRLRAWSVYTPGAEGRWAGKSPFDLRPFVKEVDGWKAELEAALAEMAALRRALVTISARYFEGSGVLFEANAEALRLVGDGLDALAELYNGWPGAERRSLEGALDVEATNAGGFLIDVSGDEEATEDARALLSYLVDMAKAEALGSTGDAREAARIAQRHLGFDE